MFAKKRYCVRDSLSYNSGLGNYGGAEKVALLPILSREGVEEGEGGQGGGEVGNSELLLPRALQRACGDNAEENPRNKSA